MKILLLNKKEQADLENIINWELSRYHTDFEFTHSEDVNNHLEDLMGRAEHLKQKIKKEKENNRIKYDHNLYPMYNDCMKTENSIFVLIDDDHRDKLDDISFNYAPTFFELKENLGVKYYGDKGYITELNPDYFLLNIKYKDKVEEFRQYVYNKIDYFYDNRVDWKVSDSED